jgi:hypothetical protein
MIVLLVLALILNGYQLHEAQPGPVKGRSERQVPPGFAYPESPSRTELKEPIRTRFLGGTVMDADGFPLSDVLVERVEGDWGTRLGAAFSSSDGVFLFNGESTGMHFLRLSKPGSDTLLVRVITSKKARHPLKLRLRFST